MLCVLSGSLGSVAISSCLSSTHFPGSPCEQAYDGRSDSSWVTMGEGEGAWIEVRRKGRKGLMGGNGG